MAGCVKTRTTLPPELIHDSKVLGMTGVRTWAFEHSPEFEEDFKASVKQAQRYSPTRHVDASGHFNILALSGGGANGAFGAGILCGWSAKDTRPTFKTVTGISTGALIAPFAFLGTDYDQTLKQVYTSVSTKDIVKLRSLTFTGRGLDSLADSSPLQRLIEKYVTDDVIRSVALAHQTGRRLYIGTTDLDSSRLVIWNMGVVAASDRPEAFDLFRKILLASASIPIIFPPVYIPVEVRGEIYEEMHVDGGVATQVFFYADIINLADAVRAAGLSSTGAGRIYIIQNIQSVPRYEPVESNLVKISIKTIMGILANQGNGDLYRIYSVAQREGIKFKLVFIPSDFELQPSEIFDPVVMAKLFDLGYRMALSGDPWQNHPPGYKD
jgi:predicted patatin/cPLA2 family phospholipase